MLFYEKPTDPLDLIKLSDAFRRSAEYQENIVIHDLVRHARNIAALTTHYISEQPDLPENKKVDAELKQHIRELAEQASFMDYDFVTLPISGNSQSWVASRIRENILKEFNIGSMVIEIGLQEGMYNADLSMLGPVNKAIPTVFDEDLRGVMDIGLEIP